MPIKTRPIPPVDPALFWARVDKSDGPSPCYTQADLDAAVQAERVRAAKMLDDAASRHRTSAVKPSSIVESQAHELAAALLQSWANAIHMETDTPALDAALAQAREKAIKDAAAYLLEQMNPTRDREAAVDLLRIFAERSAAAGEEGK